MTLSDLKTGEAGEKNPACGIRDPRCSRMTGVAFLEYDVKGNGVGGPLRSMIPVLRLGSSGAGVGRAGDWKLDLAVVAPSVPCIELYTW